MNKFHFSLKVSMLFAFSLALATMAQAQLRATTFVSITGTDNFQCSSSSPCRTFNAAIAATQPRGEVIVLKSGNYDPVTINKSVTLHAPYNVVATITSPDGSNGLTGILIEAGATDVIVLRNLNIVRINNVGPIQGIDFVRGGVLHVERCIVDGFPSGGIKFTPFTGNGDTKLFVSNTIIRNVGRGSFGLMLNGFFATSVEAVIDQTRIENGGFGLMVQFGAKATLKASVVSGNERYGILVAGDGSVLDVDRVVVSHNGVGLESRENGLMRVAYSTITNNVTGISALSGGQVLSRTPRTNTVAGNGAGTETFTGTYPAK